MIKRPLNLTIDEDLILWTKKYSKKERTTVSALINQLLSKMKEAEQQETLIRRSKR